MSQQPRASVCLNMIVKNESKIIQRMLATVVQYIDTYVICDTGSTDDTKAKIVEFFAQHPHIQHGKIINEPFRDFEYNRTFALTACEGHPSADYILLLDADMRWTSNLTPEQFRIRLAAKGGKDLYMLMQGSANFFYKNARIVRNNIGAKYRGVTHEFVAMPPNSSEELIEIEQVFIDDVGDGGSKTDKFERDIRLLTKGLLEEKEEGMKQRYTFYLANSYHSIKRWDEAIPIYLTRSQMGGFGEEVWYSLYRIGDCYKNKDDIPNAVYWYLLAYQYSDYRAENLYEVIKIYRETSRHRLCKMYYDVAKHIRDTKPHRDHLFMQNEVYDHLLDYELSIFGCYLRDSHYTTAELRRLSMQLLNKEHMWKPIQANVLSNYKHYSWKIRDHCILAELEVDDSSASSGVSRNSTAHPVCRLAKSIQALTEDALVRQKVQAEFRENTPFWNSSVAILAVDDIEESVSASEGGTPGDAATESGTKKREWIINQRFVNYYIGERGEYISQRYIQTVNVLAKIDASGNIIRDSLAIMSSPASPDRMDGYYVGLEDVRLFSPVANANPSIDIPLHSSSNPQPNREVVTYEKLYYNANRGLVHTELEKHQTIAIDCGRIPFKYLGDSVDAEVKDREVGEFAIDRVKLDGEVSGLVWKDGQGRVEKNWCFLPARLADKHNRQCMVYGWSPLEVGVLQASSAVTSITVPEPEYKWIFKSIIKHKTPYLFERFRGSTNGIRVGREIWMLVHVVSYEDRRFYFHAIVALDADTYLPIRYTDMFTFEGKDVEYCLGMTLENVDGRDCLFFGYSVMDRNTRTCLIPVSTFDSAWINC
jgi:glycosyltransferase involved in cell wall biosynthesis